MTSSEFELKLYQTINALKVKGNEPTLVEISRQTNDAIIDVMKKLYGGDSSSKYLSQLMGIKTEVNVTFKGNTALITYSGRIGGILDSIRVTE